MLVGRLLRPCALALLWACAWGASSDMDDGSCQLELQRHHAPKKSHPERVQKAKAAKVASEERLPHAAHAQLQRRAGSEKHKLAARAKDTEAAGANFKEADSAKHEKAGAAKHTKEGSQKHKAAGSQKHKAAGRAKHQKHFQKAGAVKPKGKKGGAKHKAAGSGNHELAVADSHQDKEVGSKKHKRASTFAVTTRVYLAELPYLRHFLNYYLHKLKVQKVYLFPTKDSEEKELVKAVRDFGFYEKQVVFVKGPRNASLQRLNYKAVAEDFLLDVDCDEFLLPPAGGLHAIVAAEPDADVFHLEWICYPSDTTDLEAYPLAIPCTGLKGMIRTKSLHDHHGNGNYTFKEGTPMCGKGRCVFGKKMIPLAHIQYRGFWDSVLKDVSSDPGTQWMLKGQPKSVALRKIRSGQPAKRMQSLAFEMVCVERFGQQLLAEHNIQASTHVRLAIDGELQARALHKAGLSRLLKLGAGKSYRRYKQALHQSFDKLLCNPKAACGDVKPHHISKMLSKLTSAQLRGYHGRCHSPELGAKEHHRKKPRVAKII